MAQKRRKNKVSGKTVRKIIILIVVLVAAIIFGMKYLKKKVTDNFAVQNESTVKSAQVTTGSISTTVSGSGTLKDQDSETIEIPSTVTLNKIYVEEGDTVAEGDLLATVDSASVLSSMSDLQSQIDELDEDLADAEDDSASSSIKAAVSGRVKVINPEVGDDVASTMYEKGSLMLFSLDGYLAVDVETSDLSAGDEVSVKVDDTTYEGTVDTVIGSTATILISDKTAAVDADATVSANGTEIGTGKLYIHESLAITGYAGTVKTIKVEVNDKVDAGDTLMTLEDTDYSANYAAILKKRNKLEDQLQELIAIYKKGAIYATCSGTITEITDNSEAGASTKKSSGTSSSGFSMSGMFSTSTSSTSTSTSSSDDNSVFGICPDQEMVLSMSVDESKILSVKEGMSATISIDSIEDKTFTGTVSSMETSGTSSNGVTSYTVEISMTKETEMLEGMSASAAVTIEGVENALLVPAAAVSKTSSSAYVYTTYDEENDTLGGMVQVTTGITNGNYVEITSGLSEGETVYYNEKTAESSFSFGGGMPSGFGGGNGMPSGDFSGFPSGGSGSGMPSGFPSGGSSSGGSSSGRGNGSGMPSGFSGKPSGN